MMATKTDSIPKALDLARAIVLEGLSHRLAVNRKDGSPMIYVPAGEFEMGDGQRNDCPKHKVQLSAYWIGVYCVTNAQYLQFMQATKHRAPDQADYGNPVWKGRSFPPEQADHPVVCVSWDDATAYAKWSGCALPTEAQWEKAARGPGGLIYPWGNDWDAGRCRNDKNKGNETTCPVSGYPGGVSGYGTYNQGGNVWEWCSDWYDSDYYGKSPARDPRGPEGGSFRVYRGGGWGNDGPEGFRGAGRTRWEPGHRTGSLGFRLVRPASPPPPS
jgi:formylglycine-generating enzyme required for sulfatase activity